MTATPFQKEAWTEYGLGVCIIFLRMYARWKSIGWNWQGDDYFAVLSLIFWTAELTMLELIGQYGTNIGVTDEMGASLSSYQLHRYELGSKFLLIGWTCYVTLIWCLKASMLFFYNRITLGLTQQKVVKANAVLCAITYGIVIIVIYTHCTPIQRKWQVYPNPGDNCTLDLPNYLSLVVTNITTDAIMISIPVPLLWAVKIPLRRKLMISVLLCSGIFIMVATLLRCILSIRDINGINTSTIWAIRETFVGLIAVNAGCIKPLFSSARWIKGSNSSSTPRAGYLPHSSGNYPHGHTLGGGTGSHALSTLRSAAGNTKGTANDGAAGTKDPYAIGFGLTRNESEEEIVKEAAAVGVTSVGPGWRSEITGPVSSSMSPGHGRVERVGGDEDEDEEDEERERGGSAGSGQGHGHGRGHAHGHGHMRGSVHAGGWGGLGGITVTTTMAVGREEGNPSAGR